MTFQSSCVGGSASLIHAMNASSNYTLMNPSSSRNINLGFPAEQVHSSMSLSLSNITGESSAADYQDCGLSPIFIAGESWESTLEASCPQARDKAKMRYNEKKKTRMYASQLCFSPCCLWFMKFANLFSIVIINAYKNSIVTFFFFLNMHLYHVCPFIYSSHKRVKLNPFGNMSLSPIIM